MDNIKAATIGVFHHDCQTSLSTEKFPGVTLEQLSPVVYLSKKPKKIDYSLIWNISTHSKSELDEYLGFVKKDKATIRLHVLERGQSHALILLRFKGAHSTYDAVLSNKVTPTSPTVAQAGYEVYNLVAEDPKNIEKMLRELSCIGDIKVMRLGDFSGRLADPKMTKKQADALKVALINNYYTWPRGATLESLANVAKISRRSMQERLRRAESKFIPFALKDYLKKKF
jgi:predicted DNA binding protein